MNAETRTHATRALAAMRYGTASQAFTELAVARSKAHSTRPGFGKAHLHIADTESAGVLLRASTALAAGDAEVAIATVADLVEPRP